MMFRILVLIVFLISFVGNVPAQSDQENAIKKVIEQFFDGLQSGDTLKIKNTVSEKILLQTTYTNKEGNTVLQIIDFNKFLKSLASKKPEDIWQEKLLSYNIQVDGTMANVWTPYEFYLNNDFSHCGVNSFQLFLDNGQWKIIYLIDTRRKKSCKI